MDSWQLEDSSHSLTWVDCGTRVLVALDETLKQKLFWKKQNATKQLATVAATDLLMSFCLHEASSAYFTLKGLSSKRTSGPRTTRKSLEAFVQICKFNIEKLIALRMSVARYLGLKTDAVFEDSALKWGLELRHHLPPASWHVLSDVMEELKRQKTKTRPEISSKELMLLQATGLGLRSLCEFALKLGANPNISGWASARSSVLHQAVSENDVPALRSLLQAGADVNRKSAEGLTPLLLAARLKTVSIVDLLIESGATFDTPGCEALQWATHSATIFGLWSASLNEELIWNSQTNMAKPLCIRRQGVQTTA